MAKKTETKKSTAAKKTEKVKTVSVNPAKTIPKNFKSTAEIKVSEQLIDRIMGQDKAVEIDDLDLDNQIQIDTRLDIKSPVPTVKTKKQIVNKK